ncbi:MAG: penicillin-binding protein, partial [Propionibacteriales bacterium]|nr:penicillin-binding protein [Propionibacteriales bacterium]
PDEDTKTGRVAAMIGQGQVQASPMAMAAVAASVEAGRTVIPVLVDKYAPTSKAKPLTSGEAGQLRAMMRRTVTNGSATFLRSYEKLGAKTGTAEYGTDDPPRTHAWMIVEGDDLALAVFVADGDSGSATAGPIVRAVLASR